jgi:hypothetical protein
VRNADKKKIMKSRTTVFLIVALMACVAYVVIWRGEFFLPPTRTLPPENTGPLLGDGPVEPVELTLRSQAGERIKFRSGPDGWKIVEPIEAAAIDGKIQTLIKALASITCIHRYQPTDPDAPDVSVTGLQTPRWTVTLTGKSRETRVLEIGLHVPLSGNTRTYVRLAGDKQICVVPDDLTGRLSQPVSYYRSPRVLEIAPESIMSVLVSGSETYSLYRMGQDQWAIKSETGDSGQLPTDRRETQAFLNHFAHIDAHEFVDDNPSDLAPYGLAGGSERLKVTVAFMAPAAAKAQARTIIMGLKTGSAGKERVFAKLADNPAVFTLAASLLSDLQPGELRLRDKTIIPVNPNGVSRIEIVLESGSITLVKTKGRWNITAPQAALASQQRVELILSRLATLRAKGFRREKTSEVRFGFARPRGEIRLLETGSTKPVTLKIGADSPTGAVAFVKSSTADLIASVDASEVKVFLSAIPCYYDPTLWRLAGSSDVKRIALKRPDGEVELTGASDGPWRMTKPVDAPVETESVNSILDHLDNLTATRIVSVGTKTRAYYERGSGLVSVTFAVRGQDSKTADETHTFSMAILNKKVYGWMSGDPLGRVGQFSGGLYRQFSAELRRRKILDFDPQSVDGITLGSGKTSMVLKKTASGWKYPQDPHLKVNPSAVSEYLKQIGGLTAVRFIQHDGDPKDKFDLKKSKAWLVLELTRKDADPIVISVSRKGSDETQNRYASSNAVGGVFTISAETAAALTRKIADLKQVAP